MFFRKWLLPALAAMLANLFVASAAPLPPLASGPRDGQIAKQVARMLPVVHLLQTPLDEAMSARAWTNYLNMLDYDHSYLLQSDIDQFATNRFSIGDALLRLQLDQAFNILFPLP